MDGVLMQIELLLGSIGVTLSIFFGILLLNQRDKASANLFLAIYLLAFGLRVGKSLFHNYYDISQLLRVYFLNFLFCVGPALWLFTKRSIITEDKTEKKDWLHFLVFLSMLVICFFIAKDGSKLFAVFYNATIAHMFLYMIYSFYWLRNKQKELPVFKDNPIILWLNAFLLANIIMVSLYFLISVKVIPYYLGLSFSYSIIIVMFSAWVLKYPFLFKSPLRKYKSSNLDKDQAQLLFEKLQLFMGEQKPYLDASLSLANLSERVGATTKEVSQAINQVENLNYSQYISKFRVEEAKTMLRSPSFSHYKIAAIAYDSGFNSISSFNSIFKRHTSVTAKEYRTSGV